MAQNQTEAAAYCFTLGRMQLAEIKSQSQFDALDQANVEEWPENWGNKHIGKISQCCCSN